MRTRNMCSVTRPICTEWENPSGGYIGPYGYAPPTSPYTFTCVPAYDTGRESEFINKQTVSSYLIDSEVHDFAVDDGH